MSKTFKSGMVAILSWIQSSRLSRRILRRLLGRPVRIFPETVGDGIRIRAKWFDFAAGSIEVVWRGAVRAWITSLNIRSLFRGMGIGKKLLEAAILEMQRRGIREIDLAVSEKARPARRLYESLGFQCRGEQVGRQGPGLKPKRMLYLRREMI